MYKTEAVAKTSKDSKFEKITIERGSTSEDDVEIDVKFCGICHTDIHVALNDFGGTIYPNVPGHEAAGVVSKVGKNVKDIKVGDHVGIGYLVDSCLNCDYCKTDEEEICDKGMVRTSNGALLHGRIKNGNGKYSYGGMSKKFTAHQRFVTKIPKSYPLEKAGPIFCAGITMFTPLKDHGAVKGGLNVGIAGFGGLGQMGVMLAKAMGNRVTVISTNRSKEKLARELGADNFVVSKDPESMASYKDSLNLILNTISVHHPLAGYLGLLKKKGTIVQIGAVAKPFEFSNIALLLRRLSITGTVVGGMKTTQECMDFCAKHNIFCKIEMVDSLDGIEVCADKLMKGNDAGLRYVVDINKALK